MGRNSLAPASAAAEGRGQDVDQLSSRIDSTNTKSADTNQAQLIKVIKAHLAKGDKLWGKANDHYTAAGKYLADLKAQKPKGISWENYLDDCGFEIGRRRADELILIGKGYRSVEEIRAEKAKSVANSRAALALRSAENADDPEASAEEMRAATDDIAALINNVCLPRPKTTPAERKKKEAERRKALDAEIERLASKLIELDRDTALALHDLIEGDPSDGYRLAFVLARKLGLDDDDEESQS
jgi:hypothetical protein